MRHSYTPEEQSFLQVLQAMVQAIESHDPYSQGHSQRVTLLTRMLAPELDCPQEIESQIEVAATLHDIDKLSLNDDILLKKETLIGEEWHKIKQHPVQGAEILRPLEFLQDVIPIIESHHEQYDGSGYPRGLKGGDIPLGACILAVADAYVALTSPRPYRPAFSHEQAMETIRDGAGRQWDPNVVAALLRVAEKREIVL
jgi:putative nucleotidyltransferase with HDIG domain